MFTFILLCLLVGALAGFLAGLFGIGGGLVIVPTLVYLLPIVDVPESLLMSTALGTSFATIVITGIGSVAIKIDHYRFTLNFSYKNSSRLFHKSVLLSTKGHYDKIIISSRCIATAPYS